MRIVLLLQLLFFSFSGFTQNTLFSINGTGSIGTRNTIVRAYGLDISATKKITGGFYLGANAGVMNFRNLEKPYFPVALNMTFFPLKNTKANAPYLTFQPGYGHYDFQIGSSDNKGDYDGGFTYFAGIGFLTKSTGKTRANFSLGYSSFGVNQVYMRDPSDFTNPTYLNRMGGYRTFTLKIGLTINKGRTEKP